MLKRSVSNLNSNFKPTLINTRTMSSTPNSTPIPPTMVNGVRVFALNGETDHGLELSENRLKIVESVKALFCSKPTSEIFSTHWTKSAVFEDPIAIAVGEKQYKAQWFGMPAAFPVSKTLGWKVVKNEEGLIEYEQRQEYTVAVIGKVKVMSSVVHIELDSEERITRLEDRWDGNLLPSGSIARSLRGLNGKFMPFLISVPKV